MNLGRVTGKENVFAYGETTFVKLVPYLLHADVGIAPFVASAEAGAFATSLKITQYIYSGLPIVAPHFISAGRSQIFGYDPAHPTTAIQAFKTALAFHRGATDRSGILDWDDVILQVLREVGFVSR